MKKVSASSSLNFGVAELAKSFGGIGHNRWFNQNELTESLRGFRYLRTSVQVTRINMKSISGRLTKFFLFGFILLPVGFCYGQESNGARSTPLTRPELKRLIEDVKVRVPRIPLPELTEADREKLGDQVDSYESRVKHHYFNGIEVIRPIVALAAPVVNSGTSGFKPSNPPAFAREQDPNYSLDNAFKIELFWIVSRVNNCQYCIGHQESKLLGAGRSEDQIAALDGDWSEFEPAQQKAFAFARKFTFQPHLLDDQDIVGLKAHFSDSHILEMLLSMSGNNSINRWKEAVGVPQRKDEGGYSRLAALGAGTAEIDPKLPKGTYLTPTSSAFEKKVSKVAVFVLDEKTDATSRPTLSKRPPLESRDEVEKKLAECRSRKSRLNLVEDAQARKHIPGCLSLDGAPPAWVRLIANFPKAGSSRFDSVIASQEKGDLSPLFRAQLSWILARQDRAWYALGLAQAQLRKLGQTDEDIYALDGDWSGFSEKDRALFQIAKQLGTSPVVLSDDEVKAGVGLAGARDVVQTISYTTSRASFNRLTEAAGLPL